MVSYIFIQAPSEARGLGRKNWKKEVVCIMHACDRGGGILVVCLLGIQLLPAGLTNPTQTFRACCGPYWLCIFLK